MNKLLEENEIPTIWISNDISAMDNAFIRRFKFVIELRVPPRSKRKDIITKLSAGQISKEAINKIANNENLSPAVFSNAMNVINILSDPAQECNKDKIALDVINGILKAQSHKIIKMNEADSLPNHYDPSFLNCKIDLIKLVKGIKNHGSARLCLNGPPGTGKTAFARWVSNEIDKPLIVKKASDLISCYVGETEKNIADAFMIAEEEKALLLIDEVDSFLQDRRNAKHSWEVTAVNEMLTQMEIFSGIFIASTNLMDNLDKASLRRFDIKITLDYLSSSNAVRMLKMCCDQFGIQQPTLDDERRVKALTFLTPGDFAVIRCGNRLIPISNSSYLVDNLEEECKLKGRGSMQIGFGN